MPTMTVWFTTLFVFQKKDNAELRIGYLKCYAGTVIQLAVALFFEKYPDVDVHIISGNHEDLYDALRSEKADIVMNDQRRAFSDEYVNYSLAHVNCSTCGIFKIFWVIIESSNSPPSPVFFKSVNNPSAFLYNFIVY